jgi:hypothetical protein
MQLLRIKSERLELPAPFSQRIAEPLDADAAGKATFDGSFDQIGREEGERDGQVDLANAALFADADFLDCDNSTGDDIVEPLAAFGDGADQSCASLELFGSGVVSGFIMWQQDRRDFLDGGCK